MNPLASLAAKLRDAERLIRDAEALAGRANDEAQETIRALATSVSVELKKVDAMRNETGLSRRSKS